MNPSLKASSSILNSPPLPEQFQMTILPEIAYLTFVEENINKSIREKYDVIFLSTSAKMQQDFKKYCKALNFNELIPEERLNIETIIKSLWQRMQETQYSISAEGQTIKMNQTHSGYAISFAQAQSLMSDMNTNRWAFDMAFKIVKFAIVAKQYVTSHYNHPDQSMQEYINKQLKSQSGLKGEFYVSIPDCRKAYKTAETLMVSAVCEEHVFEKDKTVEIGAGKLEEGLSYLMERMPPHLRKKVEPTELHNAFRKNLPGYKRIDICKMKESYRPSSVNKIIGASVLDVLSPTDLPLAFQQMHATLKPGGKLIHFAHMEPFRDTLLTSYRDETSVCFPWRDEENFKGLLRVQKDKLLDFISKNEKLSAFARGFLSWYSALTESEREMTLSSTIMGDIISSRDFCKWIKEINPDGLENIDNMQCFEERMRSALESVNFEIEEFGCRWQNHIRDRCETDDLDHNFFAWEMGKKTAATCYVLRPGKVCHVIKMHIIVAKKREM